MFEIATGNTTMRLGAVNLHMVCREDSEAQALKHFPWLISCGAGGRGSWYEAEQIEYEVETI